MVDRDQAPVYEQVVAYFKVMVGQWADVASALEATLNAVHALPKSHSDKPEAESGE